MANISSFKVEGVTYTYDMDDKNMTKEKVVSNAANNLDSYSKSEVDNLLAKKINKQNPEGSGSFGLNRKADITIGEKSFTEGNNNASTGFASHTEGEDTKAEGYASHAEGYATLVVNNSVDEHSGDYAHAEGIRTTAIGSASHAEGGYTRTNNPCEHAEGRGNISNKNSNNFGDSGNTIHSIGIGGTEIGTFKNAFEVMQNGDIYIIGIGGYDGTNPEDSQTLQKVLSSL